MDLDRLHHVVTVADCGSLSRAAAVLHLGQPSLSRQIALLEREWGQRLLVRTGRGVTPAEAGALLLIAPSGTVLPTRIALGALPAYPLLLREQFAAPQRSVRPRSEASRAR